jgi:hypothetical protein
VEVCKFSAVLGMEGILFSHDEKGGQGGVELGCLGGRAGEGQSIGPTCRCSEGSQYSKGCAHGHVCELFGRAIQRFVDGPLPDVL